MRMNESQYVQSTDLIDKHQQYGHKRYEREKWHEMCMSSTSYVVGILHVSEIFTTRTGRWKDVARTQYDTYTWRTRRATAMSHSMSWRRYRDKRTTVTAYYDERIRGEAAPRLPPKSHPDAGGDVHWEQRPGNAR